MKQFYLTLELKDAGGHVLAREVKHFGLPFEKILRGPIPDPFVKGGTTRRSPFTLPLPEGTTPSRVEALLTYSLIPNPDPALKEQYLSTLTSERERKQAVELIEEYAQERVLTFRTKAL